MRIKGCGGHFATTATLYSLRICFMTNRSLRMKRQAYCSVWAHDSQRSSPDMAKVVINVT